ncbi:unnamed protein product [Alopecurus aequalis]
MNLQARVLLFASIAAALIMSRGAAAAAGSHPIHEMRGNIEDDAGYMELEEEAAAYPQRRVLYGQQYISYNTVHKNNAACHGNCPAPGGRYTGPGCKSIYGCRGR